MNNFKRRRDSVASVYRKTTKFLSANTPNLLKKVPLNKKQQLLVNIILEQERKQMIKNKIRRRQKYAYIEEDDDDLGERELEYYLGVRKKENCWRDKEGPELIRKDYLLYHCGVSEDDYILNFQKSIPRSTYTVQPKSKKVPLKIHKKKSKKENRREESWCERSKIFKLFTNKKENESTSSSYSIDSIEEAVRELDATDDAEEDTEKIYDDIEFMTKQLDNIYVCDNVEILLREVRISINLIKDLTKEEVLNLFV